ncbi:MAG: cysteine-rich CWC family protein [Chitinophagaceae bacterium]|nr:cysteine-rich CWC family protein [Chitinophagaceae bacterium]
MKHFECNAMSIESCECKMVGLSENDRATIAKNYSDCLCVSCLTVLSNKG